MLKTLLRALLIAAFCLCRSIHAAGPGVALSGMVTTGAGDPVPSGDLVIEARGDSGRHAGRVTDGGRYEFTGLQPGRYRIRVRAAGHVSQELAVTLHDGVAGRLDIIMTPLSGYFPAPESALDERHPGIAADDPLTREAKPVAETLADPDGLRVTSGGAGDDETAGMENGRFMGSLEVRWSPVRLAGRTAGLTRPGLGGVNRYVGENSLRGGVSLSGPLRGERLFFSASYRPEWRQTSWDFSEDTVDLSRDQVTAANNGPVYRLARRQADPYDARLLWRITGRHQLLLEWSGNPEAADGTLRWIGRRINPWDDPGVKVLPQPQGVTMTDSVAGAGGRQRSSVNEGRLHFTGFLLPHLDLELHARLRRAQTREIPDAASDQLNYTDLRRAQVFAAFQYAGARPVTSPAQYHFGGLGLYTGDAGERSQNLRAALSSGFNLHGRHKVTAGIDYEKLAFHDNPLRSGPRGENAPMVFLRQFFGAPIPSSVIRIRRGATVQVGCAALIDPTTTDFASACPVPLYSINGASLTPPQRDIKRFVRSLFIEDQWQIGPVSLVLGARRTAAAIGSPNRYQLFSDRTGTILTGPDGWPVGSREDDVPYNPVSPLPPVYAEGEGIFIAGHYKFPPAWGGHLGGSWDIAGDGHAKLYGAVARVVEQPSEELSEHAFENDFKIANIQFANPDLSGQSGIALTGGGGTTKIAGGTRMGFSDQALLGLAIAPAPGLRFNLQLRYRRLGRLLSMTQANSPEAIANWTYDSYLYRDATLGTRYCLNCAAGQYSLFPGYTPAWDATGPNPDARGYLSETLANPGDNTPPGLFPKPRRVDREAGVSMTWNAIGETPFSLQASARYGRASGNYYGQHDVSNGLDHPELTSQYKFPLSGLTRSIYAVGRIEDAPPAAASVTLTDERLFAANLSAALRLNWEAGALRTPMLALPGWQYEGDAPGIDPAYYAFDLNLDNVVDRLVLRDFTAVPRGHSGRTPDRITLDLRLNYLQRLGIGNVNYSLTLLNMTNRHAVTAFDDQLQLRLGYVDQALTPASVVNAPHHDEPPSDLTLRTGNPWYGLATDTQQPRRVEFGVAWSF